VNGYPVPQWIEAVHAGNKRRYARRLEQRNVQTPPPPPIDPTPVDDDHDPDDDLA